MAYRRQLSSDDENLRTERSGTPSAIDFPKLFCFGDSLTQRSSNITDGCWGSIIASHYQRQVDVLNRGFSGYTSRQAVYVLPRILAAYRPKQGTSESPIAALLIWFGANDACCPASPVHVPVEEYGQNLNKLIDQALACDVPLSRIVLVTPPEYCHDMWKARLQKQDMKAAAQERASGRPQAYAKKCIEVAKQRGVILVDVYKAMAAQPNWRSLLLDGLHFNTTGAEFVANLLRFSLDPLLSPLPVMFPLSADSERKDPAKELTGWMPSKNPTGNSSP